MNEPAEDILTIWGSDGSEWQRCITPDGPAWTDGDHIYNWTGLEHNHGPIIRPDLFDTVIVKKERR